MMPLVQEFDWALVLGMYAGTAAGLLAVVLVVSGLILFVRHLLKGTRHHRSEWP